MANNHSYVDGSHLVTFALEVREQFLIRPAWESGESERPNSLRLTAIDLFEERPLAERLAVVRDLMERNHRLVLRRGEREIFAHSDTPAAYVTDLVCEAVAQILERDQSIRSEDCRRLGLEVESELADY
jgi:hypothetical protein